MIVSSIAAVALLAACADAQVQRNEESARAPGSSIVAITGANVVPMTGDTVLADHAILLTDGVISAVAPTAAISLPSDAAIIDAAGAYVAPGLIDAHVHLRAESELASYLRHGVTTVLNMRGSPALLEARERASAADATSPRIFTSGPLLDGDPPIWSGDATRVIKTEAEARAAVAEHIELGYDFVKVYNNLDPDLLAVIVREAHAAGLAVVGHLPRRPVRTAGLTRALDAGIDLIAHGEEVFFTHFGGAPDSLLRAGSFPVPDDEAIATVAGMIARTEAAVTPNLSFIAMTARMLEDLDSVLGDPEFAALDPDVQDMWREQNPTRRRGLEMFRARERVKYDVVRRLTKALSDSAVPLLLGTDASAPGMFPGASAHLEVAELVAAGLSPYEALRAGTVSPARFLARHVNRAPLLGEIAAGFVADLVVLDANPLEDPDALRDVRMVLRSGRVVWERR